MDILTTERAILELKRLFEDTLSAALSLSRVSAPIMVAGDSGIQDNLNGVERPVEFSVLQMDDAKYQVVQSLAKWKRMALARYSIKPGAGLYTDMNALRPDEDDLRTSMHSVYVDQWDWEKVLLPEERTLATLKETVRIIYDVIKQTENAICETYTLEPMLPDDIVFLHSEELLALYPDKGRVERENLACQEHGAIFLIGIGGVLPNGDVHDGRAPDYDDWTTPTGDGHHGLNGDIVVWNPILNRSFELSSMGVRVDAATMREQLRVRGCEDRAELMWHRTLLDGGFPESIGGGIGQSRLCMLLLQKRHIGEVQVGVWPDDVLNKCRLDGVDLL